MRLLRDRESSAPKNQQRSRRLNCRGSKRFVPRALVFFFRSRFVFTTLWTGLILTLPGCHHWHHGPGTAPAAATTVGPGGIPVAEFLPNPLTVTAIDQEFLWKQIVDTVDDYFKIQREVRMRADGGIVTDGLIETFPTTGATYLEPWRSDSTPGFEKLHATLQSIRRSATVRVMPAAGGYAIDLAVYKELEDVSQPEFGTVGASTLRHDGSLVRNEATVIAGPSTLGWIRQGRDMSLEQRMLAELRGRLADPAAVQRLPGVFQPP